MANLTADRVVDERLSKRFGYPVKAGVYFRRGSIVAVNSAGVAVKQGDAGAAAVARRHQPEGGHAGRDRRRPDLRGGLTPA